MPCLIKLLESKTHPFKPELHGAPLPLKEIRKSSQEVLEEEFLSKGSDVG